MAQLEGAREQFATEPTMTNRHNVDRCELNALYESQRGRPLCRLGILLIAMGAILALIYR